ncbi:unnamed protein product [Allacma fusca]|uniref:DUF6570 domain-containing protein n=1 Tax=Allacma fusca TaxID=39272 RepID=A0A8J2L086_9HEXA|nr:unnamed protein product [Allacma fusca]
MDISSTLCSIDKFSLKTWSTAIKETISKNISKDAFRNQVVRLYKIYHNTAQVSTIIQTYIDSVVPVNDASHRTENGIITEFVKTTEIQSTAGLLNSPENEDFRSNFIRTYKKAIHVFASTPCFICDRLMFRNGVCHRCQRLNLKGKVSPQADCNSMRLKPTPPQLEELSDAETALISQVKPFVKIFHLAKGRGQFAIRGSVIHFPFCVEEVIEQLPMDSSKSGIIVVNEHREGIQVVKNLEVRPQKIREALDWLTPLELVSFAGSQCTAMAATAISFASVQFPLTWEAVTIDEILIRGDAYFREQNDLRPINVQNQFMLCDDVSGTVQNVFSGVKEHSTFKNGIRKFRSHKVYAILTVSDYSMALMKAGSRILLFDSHSRGPKDVVTASGTACVLNFSLPEGIYKLSAVIHKNVQPKGIPIPQENLQQLQEFDFNICSVEASPVSEQNNHEDSSDEEERTNEEIEDSSKSTPNIFVRNGAPLVDCMIHSIDFCEPNMNDAIENEQTEFFLNRKSGKPINASAETHLE